MAHSHSHSSVQAPDNSNARRLLWAFIVTAGFMLIEAVGGAISGSLALLADHKNHSHKSEIYHSRAVQRIETIKTIVTIKTSFLIWEASH